MKRATVAAVIRFASITAAAAAPILLASSALAVADAPPGAVACSGCHPSSARVTSPVLRLHGLDRAVIVKAMQDFRAGRRAATVMDRIAKGFTDDEVQAIAAWYATQK